MQHLLAHFRKCPAREEKVMMMMMMMRWWCGGHGNDDDDDDDDQDKNLRCQDGFCQAGTEDDGIIVVLQAIISLVLGHGGGGEEEETPFSSDREANHLLFWQLLHTIVIDIHHFTRHSSFSEME